MIERKILLENIGLQLWSIREEAEKDLLGTIRTVSEMGYKGVQFAGFFENDANDVKIKLDKYNIKPAGAHVQIDLLRDQLDETLKYHQIIGNDLIIVPWLPEEFRTTKDDYLRTAELLNGIGKKLYDRGFTLAYHNHDFEFNSFEGKTGLDILFEHTEPNHLKMELDCFWATYTKHDPLDIIDKYAHRCVSLHIKDLQTNEDKPISTEIGKGSLPLNEYVNKGKEVGVKWMIVEQEHFTKDPLESAEENAVAIRQMI